MARCKKVALFSEIRVVARILAAYATLGGKKTTHPLELSDCD